MNIFILIALLSFLDSDTADEFCCAKDMTRAQRRHNTAVAIAKKKAKKTCRKGSGGWCPQPWWNEFKEGTAEKPRLGKKQTGNKQHKSQQHRWDTYTYSHKKNTWKKEYDARNIENRNLFDRLDALEEKRDVISDEELELMWDELTGKAEREKREEYETLVKKAAGAKEQFEKFENENREVIDRFFELRAIANTLESAVYFYDK